MQLMSSILYEDSVKLSDVYESEVKPMTLRSKPRRPKNMVEVVELKKHVETAIGQIRTYPRYDSILHPSHFLGLVANRIPKTAMHSGVQRNKNQILCSKLAHFKWAWHILKSLSWP